MAENHLPKEEDLAQCQAEVKNMQTELDRIRSLAKRAIGDYDDLYCKYKEAKKTHEQLRRTNQEQEHKVEQLLQILQGAANDFSEMETKVKLGQFLQKEAEKFATQMFRENSQLSKENHKIKRQSQKLMKTLSEKTMVIDIDLDEDVDQEDTAVDIKHIETLNETINGLKDTIIVLEKRLTTAETQKQQAQQQAEQYRVNLDQERLRAKESRHSIQAYETMKDDFVRVTEIASERIEKLEESVELEQMLKHQAVLQAADIHKKHEALKRQSATLVGSAKSNESLCKALDEIERLTEEQETQRTDFETKLNKLSTESEASKIAGLEQDLNKLRHEYQALVSQNEALYKNLETAKLDLRVVREQLDFAKKGPPPPPPPPPPPVRVLNPIQWIIGKGKRSEPEKAASKKPSGHENYDKALAELMDRIKNRAQTPVTNPSVLLDEGKKKGSSELNNFIGALRKPGANPGRERVPEPEPEFMKYHRKFSKPEVFLEEEGTKKEPTKDETTKEEEEDKVELRR